MPTLQDSLVSSSARMLPMRMRPDLTATQQRYQGRLYWVVKEPVGLHYYRFQEEEYAILQMLDGRSSLDDIKERFEQQFPPQKITVEELGQFVGMLHRSGLLIADVPGQGIQLKKRRDERKRQELLSALGNILAIRFKGIDPDRILKWLYPFISWMYTRTAFCCCALFALSALTLVLVNFDRFEAKLPTFHQFFTASNWIYLGVTLALTKVIHEFGHGLTCKHYGGECHEMGVMFLVLTPCLYCNVSDSWMLPNKWHRAWIGAAGMYIEIVIASACTFLWWFSEPGLLNQLCLSTMFVCSVSTVMFNANPLLRYDGYYILSDLTEIPNLRQKASTILNRKLATWCLGLEEPDDPFLPQTNQLFFALYSIAAAIYRWVVLFSILWFLYKVFEPYGLKIVSQMIASASVAGLVIQPLWKLGKFFYVPGRLDQVRRKHVQATLAVLAVAAVCLFAVPLPHRVYCMLEIKPRDAEMVYIDVPGQLQEVRVQTGDVVRKGQLLATLDNIDVELSIADLEGKREQSNARLLGLMHAGSLDETAASEIPHVRESLAMIDEQLKEKRTDLARLKITAPADGTVLPPPLTPDKPEAGQLKNWTGTPFDKRNIGATLTDSTLFCEIGDPRHMEANLVIEQDDIEFIQPNQIIAIKLDEFPHRTFNSQITEIAQVDLKVTPRHLSNKSGGEVITKTDESGVERPQNTSYQARAPIDDPDGLLSVGLKGRAKIYTSWKTLGFTTWRYLTRTFNFKL
jgi:putative peptide zinc metalloprotease protein